MPCLINTPLMNPPASPSPPWSFKKKLLLTAGVLFGIAGLAAASAAIWYQYNFNAGRFKGVQLTPPEQQVLDGKIEVIKHGSPASPVVNPAKLLVFSEREINGYLQGQGMGDYLKVSLGSGSMSATALIPVDKEVPLIGGRTVRVKIALSPRIEASHQLALYLSDLSIGGISPPNAWMGGIKGTNLFEDAKSDPVMKGLSEGIKDLQIKDGELRLILND